MEKAREFQKNFYFCFIDYAKAFDCVDHNKLWKILQATLKQYVNREFSDVQTEFGKCRGTRNQIANIDWIIEIARKFQKNMYFCFIDYAKAFDCVDHHKLENSSRDGNTRPPVSWEICMQVKKQQLALDMK